MPQSFASLLRATAQRFPERPALVWEGGALAWRQLDERVDAFARHLGRQGVGPGDRVALSMPNGWPFVVAFLGSLALDATVAPLNPLLAPEEEARILAHLAPRLLLRLAEAERMGAAEGETAEGETAERRAVKGGTDSAAPAPVGGASGAAPALILYTSGSTGEPKGVVLSHAALAFANRSWAGPVLGLEPGDVVLAALPLSHSFGLNGALLAPLLAGATVAVLDRFSPEAALDAIARHRVTVLPGVATMFRRLLDHPDLARADLSSLRLAVSGAAPCPWPLADEWRRQTGVRLLRGYGMTELFRPISYLADDPRDLPDAIGRPVPGVEAQVVDEERQALPDGAVGELWVRTPAAMTGYFNAPEATAATLVEGWFRTGDLASRSPEGFIRIEGRKRELILRGGYSVVPAEVEAALLAHPAVREAAVVGLPHPELGEEVAAWVTLVEDAGARPEELIAHCRERLAVYKCPRRLTIVEALPRGPTGKVLKSRLSP